MKTALERWVVLMLGIGTVVMVYWLNWWIGTAFTFVAVVAGAVLAALLMLYPIAEKEPFKKAGSS